MSAIEKYVNDIKTDLIAERGYVSAVEIREKYVDLTNTPEEKKKEQKRLKEQEANA